MSTITPYNGFNGTSASTNASQTATASRQSSEASTATVSSDTSSALSSLARQLSEAAQYAEAQGLDENTRAERLAWLDQDFSEAERARFDAETPANADDGRLAQARQATAYLQGRSESPFAALSREALETIALDESGTFTTNERRAAGQQLQATASASVESPPSDTESIDGYALMVERIFNGKEPPVRSGIGGGVDKLMRMPYEFLTQSDRDLLAEMYAYGQEQGIDLEYVDSLARNLGDYRQFNDYRSLGSWNNGTSFDNEGHLQTLRFGDSDAATATRILEGEAIDSTHLDQGFVRAMLDPGYGFGTTLSMDFLEQMVVRFSSTEGSKNLELDDRFAQFDWDDTVSKNMIIDTADEITAPWVTSSDATGNEAKTSVGWSDLLAGSNKSNSSKNADIDNSSLPDEVKEQLKMIRELREKLAEKQAELQALMADTSLSKEERQAKLQTLNAEIAMLSSGMREAMSQLNRLMNDMKLTQDERKEAGLLLM